MLKLSNIGRLVDFAALQLPFLLSTFVVASLAGAHIGKGLGAVLIALSVIAWFLLTLHNRDLTPERLLNRKVYWAFFLSAFAIFILQFYHSIVNLDFAIFDTGIYANLQSNLWNHGSYFSDVLEMPGLKNHFTPALGIFSPLLSVWNTFLWLPILKLLAICLCAPVLLTLGAKFLGAESPLRFLFPVLWLVDPHVHRLVATEFQASTLALPMVLLAFVWALERRFILLTLTLLLVTLLKENLALAIVSIGLLQLLFQKDRKFGSCFFLGGILVGMTVFFVIMPAIAGPSPHLERFGPFELLREKAEVIFEVFRSVWFLPFFSLSALAITLPSFALLLAARDPQMMSFNYHYQDLPIAISYVAALMGLRALLNSSIWVKLAVPHRNQLLSLALIVLCAYHSKGVSKQLKFTAVPQDRWILRNELEGLQRQIPPDATVFSSNLIGTYFFDRKLRCTIGKEQFFESSASPKYLVVAKGLDPWPLSDEDRSEMLLKAEAMRDSGKLNEIPFEKIRVFSSK